MLTDNTVITHFHLNVEFFSFPGSISYLLSYEIYAQRNKFIYNLTQARLTTKDSEVGFIFPLFFNSYDTKIIKHLHGFCNLNVACKTTTQFIPQIRNNFSVDWT